MSTFYRFQRINQPHPVFEEAYSDVLARERAERTTERKRTQEQGLTSALLSSVFERLERVRFVSYLRTDEEMTDSSNSQEEEIRRAVCHIISDFKWLLLSQNTSETCSSGQPSGDHFPEIALDKAIKQADVLTDYYDEREGLPERGDPYNPASAVVSVTTFVLDRQLSLGKIINQNSASQSAAARYEEKLREGLYADLVDNSAVDDFSHEYLIEECQAIAAANLQSLSPSRDERPPYEVSRAARRFAEEYYHTQ